MKFTLSWLKDHLETNAALDDIVAALNRIGLEVEDVHNPAVALEGFVTAHIKSAEKHPDADKLQVCKVDIGTEIVDVVCGGPNARAGLKTILGLPGATVPENGMVLKKSTIRGATSNGMLCGPSELNLCEDDGSRNIIELPDDAPVGVPAAQVVGVDPVIEIGLTPNRGDCASVYGIARDLAAAGLGTLKPIAVPQLSEKNFTSPISIKLESEFCPAFVGCYIKGVKNGPSPEWLQKRLKAIGQRPISALVDITNYFTFTYNRPMHVFDADKLKGNQVTVRQAKQGEKILALNNKEYELESSMLVVADESGADAIAGVIGGQAISSSDDTTNVFLEVALWDPVNLAQTGRTLQVNSDARYRFERGVDPEFTVPGTKMAVQMILDLCGGMASDIIVEGKIPDVSRSYELRETRVETLGGVQLAKERQIEILEKLGCTVTQKPSALTVSVPSWRSDILGESDLVEEILRIHGFDQIPDTSLERIDAITQPALTAAQRTTSRLRRALALQGYYEAVTYSFMDEKLASLFGAATATLSNPISSELSVMRTSILPNLALAAKRNEDRGYPDNALFEIGPVFKGLEVEKQQRIAAGLRSGNSLRHWQAPSKPVDVFQVKQDLFQALADVNCPVGNLTIERSAPDYYHPGRSGAVKLGNIVIAYFGELHPKVSLALDTKKALAGFEIFTDNLPQPKAKGTAKSLLKLLPLQPVTRDFAFIVDQNVEAAMLIKAIRNVDKNLITDAAMFDVYQGKGVAEGKKSLAVSVTLQSVEKTLTDEEIEAVAQKIIAAAKQTTNAELRA